MLVVLRVQLSAVPSERVRSLLGDGLLTIFSWHHIRIVAGDDADGVGPDEAGDQDAAGEASRVQGAWVGAGAFLTHVILLECGLAWCPRQIGALTRLTVLDLSGNAIEALPVEVGNLTALTEMEVARCVPPLFEGVGGGGG